MTTLGASTGLFYAQAKSRMSGLVAQADKLQTQIGTTKRLQVASDDAVAYQRLQRLGRQGADAAAYDANLDLAASLLQQTDTALGAIGTQTAAARKAIGAELSQIVDTLVQLANATDTRGQPLLGGQDGTAAVTRDDVGFSFASGTAGAIPVGEDQSVQPTETASRVFALPGDRNVLAVLAALATTLSAGEPIAAGALDDLKAASDQVTLVRSSAGARAARVDLLQAQSADTAIDREAERSGLEDTDVTAAYTDLQKTLTVLSATQASFSKLSQLSLFDYLR